MAPVKKAAAGTKKAADGAAKRTGRKEKGELKTTSLISEESVSREIHRNETSPVSLSILYGLSPIQVANV
mgnify:CR=1 FL=1